MSDRLHMLLVAIREGVASEEAVAEARDLLSGDARVPDELKEDALTERAERAADAAALLSVLGLDDELSQVLRGAISNEAGQMGATTPGVPWEEQRFTGFAEEVRAASGAVDVAESVLGRVDREGSDWVYGPALAAAVVSEAGAFGGSAEEILLACGLDTGLSISEAVEATAGDVDLVDRIFEALALEPAVAVADAVRFECGTVDVRDAVMAEVAPTASSVDRLVTVPEPANRSWGAWVTAAVAAAVLLVVGPTALGPNSSTSGGLVEPIRFAMAAEVIVEDLSYADTVQVMQTEGDEGALIIWLDEEAVL